MERILEKYEISERPESLNLYFERAKDEMARAGGRILDFERYGVFTYMKEDVARIRDEIRLDEDNILYCYFLNAAIKAEDRKAIGALAKPRVGDKSEVYDLMPLFSLMYELPTMVADHRRRGVPSEVTEATAEMFQNQVGDYIKLHKRYGICTYVFWMLGFIKSRIIRVGRFNLEMKKYDSRFEIIERDGELVPLADGAVIHRSGRIYGTVGASDDSDYSCHYFIDGEDCFEGCPSLGDKVDQRLTVFKKPEWKKFLSRGDKVVSVHIPTGGPLTPEVCDSDLLRGQRIIEECFTDFKAFYCSSWLLDTELKNITGKESNVTRFGDRFARFPMETDGTAVWTYVFESLKDTPVSALPEKNSFAAAIKKHLLGGGHIYGESGVFKKFPDEEKPKVLIPRPLQIVVDDVGWLNGKDDRAGGGPSRTGMPRGHVSEDISALNTLGERLGMKIECGFVVGEWDPDNRLAKIPHLSKYGDAWDNAAFVDRDEMRRVVDAVNSSEYINLALHGLLHGYYMEGTDNQDVSDYYYYKSKELIMTPPDEIRERVRAFLDILDYYGIKKRVYSYIPPSFAYRWDELSKILCEFGFEYGSTIFKNMRCDGDTPSIVGVENGIVTLDRNLNLYPWDSYDCSYEDLPFKTGIFGCHLPNLLHIDPTKNGEVIDRAAKHFLGYKNKYGAVLSSGIEFAASQSMYHRFAAVTVDFDSVTIDLTALSGTPILGKPFVISSLSELSECVGGEIRSFDEPACHKNYEIIPESTVITVKIKK